MKPVIVIWTDAISYPRKFLLEHDIKDAKLAVMRTIGFLVYKDKEKVILGRMENTEYEDELFVIPTKTIKKIIYLKQK